MSEHEHDDDLGIDLDAWQAPPPPSGIADGVNARMRAQAAVAPVEAERPVRSPKRAVLIGACVATVSVAAVGAIAVFGMQRAPANGEGIVVASQPQRLALGPTAAELDAGTTVEWKRERYRVTARQLSGAATWRVGGDDTLTIDAVVGSIEATSASLRVEVQMSDDERLRTRKTIATSAVTAAAVALVTVIVYDGTVEVTDRAGKTAVPAGVAYQIKAGGENVIEEEIVVGAAAPDLAAEVTALREELERKTAELDELKRTVDEDQRDQVDPFACDEVACVLEDYAPACCARFRKTRPPTDTPAESLDRARIAQGMAALRAKVHACGDGHDGMIKMRVRVRPDGTVEKVAAEPPDAAPSRCLVDVVGAARFARTRKGGSFSYPFVFTARPPASTCDGDAALERGQDAFSVGNNTAALAAFEQAYTCRPEARTLMYAFAAACKSKNIVKARMFWTRMAPSQRDSVAAFCVANGITLEHLDRSTDKNTGRLQVQASRNAKILVDGVDHGRAPIDLRLPPGKHKVTFVIGVDKHTFGVTVKAGETTRLDKRGLE